MYLSGRPLHAVTTNLACRSREQYEGEPAAVVCRWSRLLQRPRLAAQRADTVTVCSDLLKSGGYLRMLQYFENAGCGAWTRSGPTDLDDLTRQDRPSTGAGPRRAAAIGEPAASYAAPGPLPDAHAGCATRWTFDTARLQDPARPSTCSTASRRRAWTSARSTRRCPSTWRRSAPATSPRRWRSPGATTRMPSILGHVCDHLCEHTCIRTHYDEPLAIRRDQAVHHGARRSTRPMCPAVSGKPPVAVIGAGPCGLAAAERLAYAGHPVTVFEMHPLCRGHGRRGDPLLPAAPGRDRPGPAPCWSASASSSASASRPGVDFTLDDLRPRASAMSWWRWARSWPSASGSTGRTPRASPTGSPSSAASAKGTRCRSAPGGGHRRRRHRHGLRPQRRSPRGRGDRGLPAHHRPDAGRPRRGPGLLKRASRSRSWPSRCARRRGWGLAGLSAADGVPGRPGRRRAQDPARFRRVRVRDRLRHDAAGHQPALRARLLRRRRSPN